MTPDITLHAPAGVLNGDETLSAYEVSWDDASNQMTQAGLPYPVLYASNLRPVYGIDWLGLSVLQDPVGAGMKFQAIPDAGNRFLSELDKRIYVMTANDSYLMITQGMTESTIKNKIGYAVNTWLAVQPSKPTVSIELRTDKGYQVATGFNMGELLDYLRYARKLYTTANTPYTREVEKYESTFTARISDVFGSDTVIDPDQVKDYRQVMNKSVATVSGPASESTPPFMGEGLEMMDTILPGTYTGEMFVSFTTNLVSSEYLKQFSRVTVVIDTNQTVQIIIAVYLAGSCQIQVGIVGVPCGNDGARLPQKPANGRLLCTARLSGLDLQ